MARRVLTFVATLFAADLLCVAVMGQQERTYPAYTSVTRYTEYGVKGEELRVSTTTRYESSTGDSRSVSKSDGDEHASIYRRGKGVYHSNSRTSRLIKEMSRAPGCPLRTAEELRADPKFARTEDVLGYTAYVGPAGDRARLDQLPVRFAEVAQAPHAGKSATFVLLKTIARNAPGVIPVQCLNTRVK